MLAEIMYKWHKRKANKHYHEMFELKEWTDSDVYKFHEAKFNYHKAMCNWIGINN